MNERLGPGRRTRTPERVDDLIYRKRAVAAQNQEREKSQEDVKPLHGPSDHTAINEQPRGSDRARRPISSKP